MKIFSSPVQDLLEGTQDQLQSVLLGVGNQGSVYALDVGDSQYALKTGGITAKLIRAFRRGAEVERVAHLVGINPENSLAVMDRIPGEVAYKLGFDERMGQSDASMKQVVETVLQMRAAGIEVDANPGNFLYNGLEGWGVVDYRTQGTVSGSRARLVLSLASMLTRHAPWDKPDPTSKQDEDVLILNRYLNVLEKNYPDVLAEAADEQTADRENSRKYSINLLYNANCLPVGIPMFDEFKARLYRLGLIGNEFDPVPIPSSYNDLLDVID
jgi:hypothetical protein